jgi:hypothetical protein
MMPKVSNVYSKENKEKHRCRPRAALAIAVAQGIAHFYYLWIYFENFPDTVAPKIFAVNTI